MFYDSSCLENLFAHKLYLFLIFAIDTKNETDLVLRQLIQKYAGLALFDISRQWNECHKREIYMNKFYEGRNAILEYYESLMQYSLRTLWWNTSGWSASWWSNSWRSTSWEALAGGERAGETLSGEALTDEALADEALPGEALADWALAGESLAGEALAGEARPGEALPGDALAGEALAGDACVLLLEADYSRCTRKH